MKKKSARTVMSSSGSHVASSIRTCLLSKGWTQEELARRANISRTTLHHLLQGETETPQLATLSKIARALGVTPESLCPDYVVRSVEKSTAVSGKKSPSGQSQKQAFDRATNASISEVYCDMPELFSDWIFEDWTELYSTVGEGGALTPEGVVAAAKLQNKKRDVVRKLHVVLETDLNEVATKMVETLFSMVQPSDSLTTTAQLQALLESPTLPQGQSTELPPAEPTLDD